MGIQRRTRRKVLQSIEKDLAQRDPQVRTAKIASRAPSTKTTTDINTEVQIPDSLRHPGNILGLHPGTRRKAKTRRGRKMRSEKISGMRVRVGRKRRGKKEKEKRLNC